MKANNKFKGFSEDGSAKILTELETRKRLINMARNLGGPTAEHDVKIILDKYDRALKKCTSNEERTCIKHAGIAEIHKYFGFAGNLVVGGKELIPAAKNHTIDGKAIKEDLIPNIKK